MTRWLLLPLTLMATSVLAEDALLKLPIDRNDATVPVFVMRHPAPLATLILLPGGDAGTGKIVGGKPTSRNFLSRSRDEFFSRGFNVMVAYRPSDLATLDTGYRISPGHVAELDKVITYARQKFKKPVWLIGTSRGTVSGAAAAIALGASRIDGLVLSSSITNRRTGAIATQAISDIKMPTLVVHHKNDACKFCVPDEARHILDGLKSAKHKKFILVEGGSDPEGDPCEASHWHGYIHFENETVKLITDWIKNPSN